MAHFKFDIPPDLVRELEKLSRADFDEVAREMIKGAAPIPAAEMKKQSKKHHRTGGMEGSVEIDKPEKEKGVWKIKISFNKYEHRKSQTVAHALKAMAIEYGTSKQAPRPFLVKAKNDAEKPTVEKMQEIYNEEVGHGWLP